MASTIRSITAPVSVAAAAATTAAAGGTTTSTIQLDVAPPAPASPARLAHPSEWRARADLVIAEQTAQLATLGDIRTVSMTIDGGPHALVLRVECLMASEVVSLEVMRHLNDDLPTHVEEAIGLPLSERHLELTISQYAATSAVVHAA
jgi:hypothetical protein